MRMLCVLWCGDLYADMCDAMRALCLVGACRSSLLLKTHPTLLLGWRQSWHVRPTGS